MNNALLQAEQAVLGALIQSPDRMDDLFIQAPYMSADERHRLILETLAYSYEQDGTIDLIMMATRSGANLGKIGGISYLQQLASSIPSKAAAGRSPGRREDSQTTGGLMTRESAPPHPNRRRRCSRRASRTVSMNVPTA